MAVSYYDNAILNRIKSWIKDPNITVMKPEETSRLFQTRADQNNDKPISLPLIALSRAPEIRLLNINRQPKSYDGFRVKALDKKTGEEVKLKSNFKLRAIPISLEYQIDIYTANLIDADEYAREFVFKLVNSPTIEIEIPYNNVKLIHKSTIHLEDTVEDNSDIPQRLFPTQFTRFTIKFVVDDAYYFSVVDKENMKISEFELAVVTNTDSGKEVEIEYTQLLEK